MIWFIGVFFFSTFNFFQHFWKRITQFFLIWEVKLTFFFTIGARDGGFFGICISESGLIFDRVPVIGEVRSIWHTLDSVLIFHNYYSCYINVIDVTTLNSNLWLQRSVKILFILWSKKIISNLFLLGWGCERLPILNVYVLKMTDIPKKVNEKSNKSFKIHF